jgi:hypothetical protein
VKILIHSNSATSKTGYGVQVALLVDRMVADGHDVAISATYGHPAGNGIGVYTTPSGARVNVYPSWFAVSGEDICGPTPRTISAPTRAGSSASSTCGR